MQPLPRPVTDEQLYLAALVAQLGRLCAVVEELSGRLGQPVQPAAVPDQDKGEEGGMRLLEPETPPATSGRLLEPDVPEPPRYGKGSSRQAWATHADRLGVSYPPEAGQRDIIAAVDAAKQAAA